MGDRVDPRCRLLGHHFRFTAAGDKMRRRCSRGCPVGGEKLYLNSLDARRYAPRWTVTRFMILAGARRSVSCRSASLVRFVVAGPTERTTSDSIRAGQ